MPAEYGCTDQSFKRGKMYITTRFVCFGALSIFGRTQLTIPLANIASVNKVRNGAVRWCTALV
jgi:hypothetical protein